MHSVEVSHCKIANQGNTFDCHSVGNMQPKFPGQLIRSRPRPKSFRCCWCFHVRTGTIILGIWHLILHSTAVALLVTMFFYPEAANRFARWIGVFKDRHSTPSPDQGLPPQFPDLSSPPGSNYGFMQPECSQDVLVALIITLCICGITVLLLYGAIKRRASCLMPFFWLQVFDFVLSALTAISYFSYMPNVHRWLEDYMPLQKDLLNVDSRWLCAFILFAFATCMVIKAYFMGIVWSCYKYLKIQQVARIVENFVDIDGETLLPPHYMMDSKTPVFNTPPPPPYSAVSGPAQP